jgi:CDP-diacylglycerol pyrophosphatase
MCHEMLPFFCIDVMAKRVTLSQHFVAHVIPPLVEAYLIHYRLSRLQNKLSWHIDCCKPACTDSTGV